MPGGNTLRTWLLDSAVDASIERALDLLRDGGLVVFPTDTVYGVGADALSGAAVDGLFAAKLRPSDRPIALLVAPDFDLGEIVDEIPPSARALADRFWPGGLTILLRRTSRIPNEVTVGSPSVGIRVPNHPVALRLLRGLGRPLATTSANLSGHPSPTTADEAMRQLDGRVPLILDGGRCPGGVESTVVDLTQERPRVLRLGAISVADLEAVLGGPVDQTASGR